MKEIEKAIRGLNRLTNEQLDQINRIIDLMQEFERHSTPQEQRTVSIGLVEGVADKIEDELTPLVLRARTIQKQMDSGHFNNKKISHLASGILSAAEKIYAKLTVIQNISNTGMGEAKRCTCDIKDLWNGSGCSCGAMQEMPAEK